MKFKNIIFLTMLSASTVSSIFSFPASYTRLVNPKTHQIIHLIGDAHIPIKNESEDELLKILFDALDPERQRFKKNIPVKTKLFVELDFPERFDGDGKINLRKQREIFGGLEEYYDEIIQILGGERDLFLGKLFKRLNPYVPAEDIDRQGDAFKFYFVSLSIIKKGIDFILNESGRLKDSINYLLINIRQQYQNEPTILEIIKDIYNAIEKKDQLKFLSKSENLMFHSLDIEIIKKIQQEPTSTKNLIMYVGLAHAIEVTNTLVEKHNFKKLSQCGKNLTIQDLKSGPVFVPVIDSSAWMCELRQCLLA